MSQAFHPVSNVIHAPTPLIAAPEHADALMAFGVAVVALLFICRSLQSRAPVLLAGTIFFGMMAAIYGCWVGAWPLGVAVFVYVILAYKPGFESRRSAPKRSYALDEDRAICRFKEESRVSRLFGTI